MRFPSNPKNAMKYPGSLLMSVMLEGERGEREGEGEAEMAGSWPDRIERYLIRFSILG